MVQLKNISKVYDKNVALKNINIEITTGSILGVIGRNGAGKSTLFKIISGIMDEYEGEVLFNSIKGTNVMSPDISYLPELRGLDCRQYAMEHIVDLICYKGFKRKEVVKNVEHWLEVFGMEEKKNQKISSLSKGNQQKLQFISAVASNPKLLILDEPFSGLDSIAMDQFWKIMIELRESGTTIIFSTHNLNDNLSLCDEFLFIVEGKVVEYGKLNEIQQRYPIILEMESHEVEEKQLLQIVDSENVRKTGEYSYHIQLESAASVKNIFETLNRPFCEKFYVRKMKVTELFRLFNKEKEYGK